MKHRSLLSRQRGTSKLKALIVLVVLIAAVYVGFQIVPHYFASYQLKDAMDVEARYATVQRKSAEQIRETIYKKIDELEIPASRDDIRVETNDRGVKIRVTYTVVVDLPGYKLPLKFDSQSDNRRL